MMSFYPYKTFLRILNMENKELDKIQIIIAITKSKFTHV